MKAKKVGIIIILVLLIVCLAIGAIVGIGEDEFVIGIISDPQIIAASEVGDDAYLSFLDFNAVGQKMLFVSESILATAVDKMIEQKVDVVLMPGDLTENGSKVGHETVARECQRLEDAGIPVYVTCGNHDINKSPKKYMSIADAVAQGLTDQIDETFEDGSCSVRVSGVTPEEFMSIYANFGFNEAIANDRLEEPETTYVGDYSFDEIGTMSYVCDLKGSNYRLISLDAANYYEDENENTYYMCYYGRGNGEPDVKGTGYSALTYRLLDWLMEQLESACDDGKEPLLMLHFPINDQLGSTIGLLLEGEDNALNLRSEVQRLLTVYGVKHVFSGHLHMQHTDTYTDEDTGASFEDIETGCLTNYPLPMRLFKSDFDGNTEVENLYLEGVKENYLPSYVDSALRLTLVTKLQEYALNPFIYDNLLTNVDGRINDGGSYDMFYTVFDLLNLDPEGTHEAELASLAEYIYTDLYKAFLEMPIYKTEGKQSLESICEKYGIVLPQSDYDHIWQFVIEIIGKVYKDEGGITYESDEATILRYGIYSAFEVLRTSELFTRLHEINNGIDAEFITEGFVAKLMTEGTLSLTEGDFLKKALVIVNDILSEKLPFSINLETDILGQIDSLMTIISIPGLLNGFIPGIADRETDTILGVAVSDMFDIGKGEIYLDNILEKMIFGVVARDVLYHE